MCLGVTDVNLPHLLSLSSLPDHHSLSKRGRECITSEFSVQFALSLIAPYHHSCHVEVKLRLTVELPPFLSRYTFATHQRYTVICYCHFSLTHAEPSLIALLHHLEIPLFLRPRIYESYHFETWAGAPLTRLSHFFVFRLPGCTQ